jgi:hypothetical protein
MQFTNSDKAVYDGFQDQMYMDLMTQREQVEKELFAVEADIPVAKRKLAEMKDELDLIEAQLVIGDGGWKKMGSNDNERGYRLTGLKAGDNDYQRTLQAQRQAQADYDTANNRMANLQKQLHAIGNAMRMHAAMILAQGAIMIEAPTEFDKILETEDIDL